MRASCRWRRSRNERTCQRCLRRTRGGRVDGATKPKPSPRPRFRRTGAAASTKSSPTTRRHSPRCRPTPTSARRSTSSSRTPAGCGLVASRRKAPTCGSRAARYLSRGQWRGRRCNSKQGRRHGGNGQSTTGPCSMPLRPTTEPRRTSSPRRGARRPGTRTRSCNRKGGLALTTSCNAPSGSSRGPRRIGGRRRACRTTNC
mmetsp:Transcript_19876/g.56974  ORF Transcript_19876/g.56974 Transcript_19876/m.56974 type:complete len:201 (-) Transcript_19876:257-859(-)